ncbi:MAG TPA: 3-dehydroquinate synthase [Chryseolinea sp.]|nr:3-dehydroquinate synthase [Chryseolinea sp.]HPM31788.1 3-dehydroquinate synthase [Chryseolinea sp.]
MLPDNILFSDQIAEDLIAFLKKKKYSKLAVLVDEHTLEHCYPLLKDALGDHFVIEVSSGEEQKNLNTCQTIWQAMTDQALDRHACILVLGGGVLGDMGGFCASTYKRGIDFILVPTTLLAQVDASIGGKLGIDFNHFKNHIGVFNQPTLTILHSGFLKTLPTPELRSGFAEVIKHTLISDKAMWDEISAKSLTDQDWNKILKHSVEFKAAVTQEDPTEIGLRKILNAGHTIGHALESYLLGSGRKILHGEAVAVGLITEASIARNRKMHDDRSFQYIKAYILKIFGKVQFESKEVGAIASLALQDKKNKDNRILCVLPTEIGKAVWDVEITQAEVENALLFYRSL